MESSRPSKTFSCMNCFALSAFSEVSNSINAILWIFINTPIIDLPLILIWFLVVARDVAGNYLSELPELLPQEVSVDAECKILYEKFLFMETCHPRSASGGRGLVGRAVVTVHVNCIFMWKSRDA